MIIISSMLIHEIVVAIETKANDELPADDNNNMLKKFKIFET
jgi:hypothetical protein